MNSATVRTTKASVLAALAMVVTFALAQGPTAYTAEIHEMNPQLTQGTVSGQAVLTVDGNELNITLLAKGLPAGMRLAHIHGFTTVKAATCPAPSADVNADGIVDLIETEPAAGVTLIPFNADLAAAVILSDTYPVAADDGTLVYHATVDLTGLEAIAAKDYDISDLDLGNKVIFIHGVADGQTLPDTVASLPGVPATVTVPIACGELNPY